ncbi:MAG: hypothetical protein AAB932_01150 [Patescibacteria group bacterium]
MEQIRLFFRAIMPMWILFAFHVVIASATSVYWDVAWFDDAMHAAGGAATAFAVWTFLNFFVQKKTVVVSPAWMKMLFIVGCVAIVGIAWEVFEFLHDVYFPSFIQQGSIRDTVGDLVLDIFGAFIFSLLFVRRMR